eukprot:PhF_6_TR28633/c0_g1_i1/m.42140
MKRTTLATTAQPSSSTASNTAAALTTEAQRQKLQLELERTRNQNRHLRSHIEVRQQFTTDSELKGVNANLPPPKKFSTNKSTHTVNLQEVRTKYAKEVETQKDKLSHGGKPLSECSRDELAQRFYSMDDGWDNIERFQSGQSILYQHEVHRIADSRYQNN